MGPPRASRAFTSRKVKHGPSFIFFALGSRLYWLFYCNVFFNLLLRAGRQGTLIFIPRLPDAEGHTPTPRSDTQMWRDVCVRAKGLTVEVCRISSGSP